MSRAARLGAFIVATLAILVVSVFIIWSKQYLFSSNYQLKRSSTTWRGRMQEARYGWTGVRSGTVHNVVLPYKPG